MVLTDAGRLRGVPAGTAPSRGLPDPRAGATTQEGADSSRHGLRQARSGGRRRRGERRTAGATGCGGPAGRTRRGRWRSGSGGRTPGAAGAGPCCRRRRRVAAREVDAALAVQDVGARPGHASNTTRRSARPGTSTPSRMASVPSRQESTSVRKMSTRVALSIASTCWASSGRPASSSAGAMRRWTACRRRMAVNRPSAPPPEARNSAR